MRNSCATLSVNESKLLELPSISFCVLDRQRMHVIGNRHNFSIGSGPCKFVDSFPFIKGECVAQSVIIF